MVENHHRRDRPDHLANDERFDVEAKRVQNVDQVDAIVSEWTRQRSMADVVARMTERGIPASEIASVEAVIADRTMPIPAL